MLTFNKKYFFLAIILFVTEVMIATFLESGFIRHYVGDFLVVILIYCFVKSFLNIQVRTAAILVLLFAYFIELMQYLDFVNWIGFGHIQIANVVLGNYFDWADLVMYTLGIAAVLITENFYKNTGVFDRLND